MNQFFLAREFCPACKSANRTELLRLSYTGSPVREYLNTWYSYKKIDEEYLEGCDYVLYECGDCGLIYQGEILNDATLRKLYEEWIDYEKVADRARTMITKNYYIGHAKDFVNILSYLDTPPCETHVLDFGMGFGTWCYLTKGFGCHAHGTELSQTRIDYAKGIDVIAWKDIPGYRFDFINTEQVFEHLSDPLEVLGYLRQFLKPNGLIKISVPDGWDLKKRLEAWDWETLQDYTRAENPEEELQRIKTIWDWESPDGSGTENSINVAAPLQHINCFNHEALVRMAERVKLVPVAIPVVLANSAPPMPMSQRVTSRIRSAVRRYYRAVTRETEARRKTTKVFFKNA